MPTEPETATARRTIVANLGPKYVDYIDRHLRQDGETDTEMLDRIIRELRPEDEQRGLIPDFARHAKRLSVYQPSTEFRRRISEAIGHPNSMARIDTVWIIRECPGARTADVSKTLEAWGYTENGRALIATLERNGFAVVFRGSDDKPRVRLSPELAEKLNTPL